MNRYLLLLALLAGQAPACEVQTDKAYKDERFGNWVIPVRLARGERCVIHDYTTAEGQKTWRERWARVEKIGPLHPDRLGRLRREYQPGDPLRVNRYVYTAGHQAGEEDVVFAAFPDGQERRAVAYHLVID
ncbi:MAG: hypothetical protein LBE53_01665 [Paucimonas sp.]|jgi:hypothetical protein|uniref:hypothetical protein n=1 Tax=Pantoea sp. Cy-639 TaxID=2608360 RepID=UPI00142145A2|nr:hypothetical protein [Pantoea sp. Cy-639]MDR2305896.1 hypothetical protein [Paucimonas sp.]NIF19615.1 hypothetical protein [Pantoea sp. Cy-639]